MAAGTRLEAVGLPGAAGSVLAAGVGLLRPQEAVLDAMLAGWSAQQRSRLLAAGTIEQRVTLVRRFVAFTNDYPWAWTAAEVEEWTSQMVGRGLAHSTVRGAQNAVALFQSYVTDRRYGWDSVCEEYFGTHPVQVFHERNTAAHRSEVEARPGNRPLSRQELQAFFDYCDEQVVRAGASGRKGWLSAFRDANAAAGEFGRYGALMVRFGKSTKGSPPRRRTVLTTMAWAAEAVAEWTEQIRPEYLHGANRAVGNALWPTERGGRISVGHVNERFADYRDALGLDPVLGPHCLRHSYVTHLLEDGFDHLFVQQQVGHSWGSTTAIYTSVGSDFKNRTLRRALDRAFVPDQPGPADRERCQPSAAADSSRDE